MTLETLYLLMQIIAAIAIVASLVFVGLQVRAQISETRLQHINERAALVTGLTSQVLQVPELRAVMTKAGTTEFKDLNSEEKQLFTSWARQFLQLQSVSYAHSREGHGNDPTLRGIQKVAARATTTTMFESWWSMFHDDYSEDVQAYVDNLREIGKGLRRDGQLPAPKGAPSDA